MENETRSRNGDPREFDPAFLDRIEREVWERQGSILPDGEILFRCPFPDHEDRNPSARYSAEKRTFHCFPCETGGGVIELAKLLEVPTPGSEGLTVEAYAEAKRLPLPFLAAVGVIQVKKNGKPAVEFAYHDQDGDPIAKRWRVALLGKQRFLNQRGWTPLPYGMETLPAAREAGAVALLEGESDAQTLMLHGRPCLGLPGVGAWVEERDAPLFEGIEAVYVVDEGDKGGAALLKKMRASAIRSSVRIVDLSPWGVKDVSALYLLDPSRFLERWDEACANARSVTDVTDVTNALGEGGAAQLLNDVRRFITRYVAHPSEETADAHTLWIAHSHPMEAWDSTPRLAFLSPEKQSGKTRAVEVTTLLVPRPVESVNATPAYLFRKVADQAGRPTILYDEIDTVFGPKAKDNEEVRGLLNAGHRKGAQAGRCVTVGNAIVTEEFPAYCAVVLAGIGLLPDTILDRSIVVPMRRRLKGKEIVKPFRHHQAVKEGTALREKLEAWSQVVELEVARSRAEAEAKGEQWPPMPEGVEDRPADVWEPLIAIADLAGGDWPERARAAAKANIRAMAEKTPSLGARLLGDVRTVFAKAERMHVEELLDKLLALPDAPWGDLRGKPMEARWMTRELSKFEVKAAPVRIGESVKRGYKRDDLADAWARYLPDPTDEGTAEEETVTRSEFHNMLSFDGKEAA